MIWIHRNSPRGFEALSLAEMSVAGLAQVSNRYFCGESFNLQKSAYGQFMVREVSRGFSPEEVIRTFSEKIPSPYRMEKFENKRRCGSLTYARLAEKIHGGDIRAALALINILDNTDPIIDPCCGTGMIPLAAMLLEKETYASDKNFTMLKKAKKNRDILGLDLEILHKDAFEPWIHDCCLVSDFPADRSWSSTTVDVSLALFTAWIPYIKSFCVILPTQILLKLPESITITKKIDFTAARTIIVGYVNK